MESPSHEEDDDLFGPSNADYQRIGPFSALKPPVLPPPQHSGRDDSRDAGGAGRSPKRKRQRYDHHHHHDGGHGRGRGSPGRPRGPRGEPSFNILPMSHLIRGDPGSLASTGPRGGLPLDAKVVSTMKLGAPGHADDSIRVHPPYAEPCELACYSVVGDGSVHFDDRALRRFRPQILREERVNLDEGFNTFIEKKEDAEDGFGRLLACLRVRRVLLSNVHFVTFRNNLNKVRIPNVDD
ncbi:hypothetical protein CBR_g48842 [Chara braunii]|uniref:Decapping nuclease n=1 Tax=Chara braunii TaxID=69332 RepID=A0A388M3I3_CHABU|nr:hypothetical protein CBR_g48842 [Chara braunii]|eukprot:GBG89134.1 hypothetical protein CBR_g48842 [Chara braunii]